MKKIVVECNPDEKLVKALGAFRKNVIHQPNKGAVCNFLKKNREYIGIVDEDPGSAKPSYLNEFKVVHQNNTELGFIVLQHPVHKTKVIVVQPRLEEWVINCCKRSNLILSKFGLPEDPKRLHSVLPSKLELFRKVIVELVHHQSPQILALKNAIK